jgi:hypothetical protein
MAVILNTKPRVRLPPGDLPEPKLVRSRSGLPYYVALWICAVIIGHGIVYHWLPLGQGNAGPASSTALTRPEDPGSSLEAGRVTPTQAQSAPLPLAPPPLPKVAAVPKPAIDLDHLPGCDVSNEQDPNHPESDRLLPVDLSRSVLGKLLEYRRWTGPCRGRHAARVHLCLAVKGGNILGATAHADPRDTSLERCVIRAASLVDLEPEDALRVVKLDVEIPREK